MSRELPEFENKILFNAEAICAFKSAFERNPETVKELENIVGQEKMKIFIDILTNTNWIEIKLPNPYDEFKTVYGQIAKRELERLKAEDKDGEDISCGHSAEEHVRALERILEKIQPTIN